VAKSEYKSTQTLGSIGAHQVFRNGDSVNWNHGLCQAREGRSKSGSLTAC